MDEKKDNFNITMPSTGGVESEDDTKVKSKDETKVEGKNNMVENIIPPRRQLKNLKGKKKPTTRTFIIEKPSMDMGSGGLQPMVNSGDSIKISQKSQSDISTLLRLQSGSTLKYT